MPTVSEWLPGELKRQEARGRVVKKLIESGTSPVGAYNPDEDFRTWTQEATIVGRRISERAEEGAEETKRFRRRAVIILRKTSTGETRAIPDTMKMGEEVSLGIYDAKQLGLLDDEARRALRRSRQRQRTRVLRRAA